MRAIRRALACAAPWLALAGCSGSDGQEKPAEPVPVRADAPANALAQPNPEAARKASPHVPTGKQREPRPIPPVLRVSAWVNSEALGPDAFAGKVVILDFWSTTSGTCRRLMPRLQALLWKHETKGLALIGVTEDPLVDVQAYAKAQGIAYPLAVDANGGSRVATFDAWNIEDVPTVWLLDRYGEVAWKGRGEDLTEARVLEELGKAAPPDEEASP